MISEKIQKFHDNNNLGHILGTRNEALHPAVSKVFHAVVSDDKKHMIVYMSAPDFTTHEDNLTSNGQVALSSAALPSHEAYQYKGTYTRHWDPDENEVQEIFGALHRYGEGAIKLGFPPEMLEMFEQLIVVPAKAFEFEVAEIYEQTPKPGTGNKL